jgi:hypothetical protein
MEYVILSNNLLVFQRVIPLYGASINLNYGNPMVSGRLFYIPVSVEENELRPNVAVYYIYDPFEKSPNVLVS